MNANLYKQQLELVNILRLEYEKLISNILSHFKDKPQLIIINILIRLDINLIKLLASFDTNIDDIYNTDIFYRRYLEFHYGIGIAKEKPLSLNYKEWFEYIRKCENIVNSREIDRICYRGKYYTFKHLLSLPSYNINMVNNSSVALSCNKQCLELYLNERRNNYFKCRYEDMKPNNEQIRYYELQQRDYHYFNILKRSAVISPEWFECVKDILNKLISCQPKEIFIMEAFMFNNINMILYFKEHYNYDLKSVISNILEDANEDHISIILLIRQLLINNEDDVNYNVDMVKQKQDKNERLYTLLNYVFITEAILDINYFKDNEYINSDRKKAKYRMYTDNLSEIIKHIGITGSKLIIDFFLTSLGIIDYINNFKEQNNDEYLEMYNKYYSSLLNGICISGNVDLLKEYIKTYITGINEIEDNINSDINRIEDNIDITEISLQNYDIIHIINIIQSNNMNMISYMNEIGKIDKNIFLKSSRKENIEKENTILFQNRCINPIVCVLNNDSEQIFDYLYDIFLKTYPPITNIENDEYVKSRYSNLLLDIIHTRFGINYINPYKYMLCHLYNKTHLTEPHLLMFLLLSNVNSFIDDIKNVIWLFELPSNDIYDFLLALREIPDEKLQKNICQLVVSLFQIKYFTYEQASIIQDSNNDNNINNDDDDN